VTAAHRAIADAGIQVLHVAGPAGEATVERREGDPAYVVVPYVDRMDLAYAAADLVVCRAGANTVTETAAVGLPAVFVPLPIGNGEQELNARPSWTPAAASSRRRLRPSGWRPPCPLSHRPCAARGDVVGGVGPIPRDADEAAHIVLAAAR
jgi:hypothetical protein